MEYEYYTLMYVVHGGLIKKILFLEFRSTLSFHMFTFALLTYYILLDHDGKLFSFPKHGHVYLFTFF